MEDIRVKRSLVYISCWGEVVTYYYVIAGLLGRESRAWARHIKLRLNRQSF